MRRHFFSGSERRGYHHGQLKDALLDAARILVAERGASGFTLAEAAKRVGVTGAAPYRHFSDRNALMAELARRGFELFGQRLAGAWDEGRPDPVTAFRRMGNAYGAFAREEPGLYAAMFADCGETGIEDMAAAAKSLTLLEGAARAILLHFSADPAGAGGLALEIWAFSHGVAMLSLSGHLNPARAGRNAADIAAQGAAALIEMAVRRGGGQPAGAGAAR